VVTLSLCGEKLVSSLCFAFRTGQLVSLPLGLPLEDVVINASSLDEQGKRMASSGSYPGRVGPLHVIIVRQV
jgi:hypothetical protein